MNTEFPTELIPHARLNLEWYVEQLTLLLKRSYGVPEQLDYYLKIINGLNDEELKFFKRLGVYAELVYQVADEEKTFGKRWVINIEQIKADCTYDGYEHNSDLLDKIGAIVGVQRNYSWLDKPLTNSEFYVLIYTQIIRNNFKGTQGELRELYQLVEGIANVAGEKVQIHYVPDETQPLNCYLLFNTNAEKGSSADSPLGKCFSNGLLSIRSMGVWYYEQFYDFDNIGFYDGYPIQSTNGIEYDKDSANVKFDNNKCRFL